MSENNTEPQVTPASQAAPVPPAPQAAPQPAPVPPAPQAAPAAAQQAYAQQQFAQPQAQRQFAQPQPQPNPYVQQPYGAPAYGCAAPAPASKEKSMAPWIIAGVFLVVILGLFAIIASSCSGIVSAISSPSMFESSSVMEETYGDTIGVIDLTGAIQYDGSACSPEGLRELLIEAEDNSDIKAVVLRVDSGGGAATAGEEMSALIKDFSKPIVVSSASMNCSAAYEISSQADYIFANKTTAIGAIGTILQTTDMSGLMEKLGIKTENFTSAESKDSSYGTRPLTDEEREHYQKLVNDINETFIQSVSEGRNMTKEDVKELATGMEFTGMEAVENGLADEIGTYDDALDKAAELGGAHGDYDVVSLTQSYSDLDMLMDVLGSSNASLSVDDLVNALQEKGTAQ